MTTETATTLTAQKLHAVLRAAGIEKSESHGGGPIPGMTSASYGYEVEVDGYIERKCRYCKGVNRHTKLDCIGRGTRRTKDGFRQRKVTTGTFTVRLRERTGICGMDDRRTDRDRVRITEALTAAGIAFVKADDEDRWTVTGFAEVA